MSVKSKFFKALFFLFLGVGLMSGAMMDAKQIEELMQTMNQTRVELTLPKRNNTGDPK